MGVCKPRFLTSFGQVVAKMRPESKVTLPSYLKPASTVPLEPVKPRPLPPLEVPSLPEHLPLPLSPPEPVDPILSKYYDVSTHLVPAAYPRLTPYIPPPTAPRFSADKDEFKASVESTLNEILGWKLKQWNGELDGLEPDRALFWNCIKRFVKKDASKTAARPLTLFFAHANGFPKEVSNETVLCARNRLIGLEQTWEPTLAHLLLQNVESPDPVDITEIWLWEAINHGDSALINSNNLGGLCRFFGCGQARGAK